MRMLSSTPTLRDYTGADRGVTYIGWSRYRCHLSKAAGLRCLRAGDTESKPADSVERGLIGGASAPLLADAIYIAYQDM